MTALETMLGQMEGAGALRGWALAFLLTLPGGALAQAGPDAIDAQVQARIDAAKKKYDVPDPRLRCRPKPGSDEIVVCVDRGEDQRTGSTGNYDPKTLEGRRALNGGVPRAPQFDRGSCKGQPGCITGGWAPPQAYMIDMTAIPEPPEGSDADKIAKGEMKAP